MTTYSNVRDREQIQLIKVKFTHDGVTSLLVEINAYIVYVVAQLVAVATGIIAIVKFTNSDLTMWTLLCALFAMAGMISFAIMNWALRSELQ